MTDEVKIPANSQVYLTAIRDNVAESFDVVEMAYDYGNAEAPAASITDDLWGYWKLDETTGNRADSVGSNDGVPSASGVGYAAGQVGNAVHLSRPSGVSGRLDMPTPPDFDDEHAFTIAFWFKVSASDTSATRYPLEIYASYMDVYAVIGGPIYSGKVSVQIYSGGGAFIETPYDYDRDAWYLVVFTFDGSTLKLYINNAPIDSITDTTACTNDSLNMNYNSSNAYSESWVDELGIWTRALSTDDIAYLWNSGAGRSLF